MIEIDSPESIGARTCTCAVCQIGILIMPTPTGFVGNPPHEVDPELFCDKDPLGGNESSKPEKRVVVLS